MIFDIGIIDILDIFLVAVLLYQTFRLLKKTGAINVFLGILGFIIAWFLISYVFKMELLGGILDRVVSVGAFALIVLFQDEIKKFFKRIGSGRNWLIFRGLRKFFQTNDEFQGRTDYNIVQIVLACRSLSRRSMGGLIVLAGNDNLDEYIHSGEVFEAKINSRLIENIFFKNSPLHDGAMIISKDKIMAASCILPVSKNQQIPKRLGLRHRSAVGITEHADAIAIIVSEETGKISYAVNGELILNVKSEELEMFLSDSYYSRSQE
jgi:uncharacterized protein (TIGR00159 family)